MQGHPGGHNASTLAHLPSAVLPYAKVMQTSAMQARLNIAECILPYAKVAQPTEKTK